jgi:hypothetical protein
MALIRLNFQETGMQKCTATERGPRPAARVGYHSGKGLATAIRWADCRSDFRRFISPDETSYRAE